MKKFFVLLLAIAMVMTMAACGGKKKESEKWPKNGFGAMLPNPCTDNFDIYYDDDTTFYAVIHKADEKDYKEYLDSCKSIGFTIDAAEDISTFIAYNKDGLKITLIYWENVGDYDIHIDTTKAYGELRWPEMGLAKLVPVPKSTVGKIKSESSRMFDVYVGQTSLDDFKEYVEACIAAGFDNDYRRTDDEYSAKNLNGDSIRVEYEEFNTMEITIYASEVFESETDKESDTESDDADGEDIVKGFKETMDSYEEFIDEYVSFMKEYDKSAHTEDLVNKYSDYLDKYLELSIEIEELNDGTLSSEELDYFNEVMNRVNEKLLESI